MSHHEHNPNLFKRYPRAGKWATALIYFLAFNGLFFGIHVLADQKIFFNMLSLSGVLVSDASLNDLHYQVHKQPEDQAPKLSGDLILINTGSIPRDSFRKELAQLLTTLQPMNAATVAIDHDFSPDPGIPGTPELVASLNQTSNLILAQKTPDDEFAKQIKGATFGSVNLPKDQITIRRYYSDTTTFGYKVAHKMSTGKVEQLPGKSFIINYLSRADGFFGVGSFENDFYVADPSQPQAKFLQVEAGDILKGDSATIETLRKTVHGKALLLGHLGSAQMPDKTFDTEDKHRVPCDSNIVEREKTMYGLMVHANAIENILNPEERFSCWSDSIWFKIFKQLFIFMMIYYLLFHNIAKAFNIPMLAICSFPVMYLSLYLMTQNIYLEMGLTLLQFILVEETIEAFESIPQMISKFRRK
jgi:hypothetical protein